MEITKRRKERNMKSKLVMMLVGMTMGMATLSSGEDINVVKVFDGTTIVKTSMVWSAAIDLSGYKPKGDYSVQLALSPGTNALVLQSVVYEVSNDGVSFYCPTNKPYTLVEAWTTNSGPTTNGSTFVQLDTPLSRYLRLRANLTNGYPATLNGWVAIR